MKKAKWFFPIIVLAVLTIASGCNKEAKPTAGKPEPPPKQDVAAEEFDSAGECQYCHLEIFEQWSGSTHALSAVNPVFLAEIKWISQETNGESDQFCVSCHAPVGWLAGETPPVDGSNLSAVSKQGVTCDLCHAITSVTGVGNAAFRVQPGNIKYGPLNDAIATPLHESEFNTIFTESDLCGACHEIVHPENGLALSSTFSEWKESSYGSRRVNCQDCHMTPGPGVTKPTPGVVATGAPKVREHIWAHNMTGNNVFAMRQAGFDDHAARAEENLKSAATLFLGLPEKLSPYQPARINIRIRNDGAGHYLPTGLSLFKDMWLEVVVTNEQGAVVYKNGVLDETGAVPADSVVFKTRFANDAGQETNNLWEATKILDDHRIPPREYVDEFVEIPGLPVPGTLSIRVRLLYRNINAKRAAQLGISATDIPVVIMAEINGQIAVK